MKGAMGVDINKPAAEIDDPMELYARIGFRRACAIARGDPNGYEHAGNAPDLARLWLLGRHATGYPPLTDIER